MTLFWQQRITNRPAPGRLLAASIEAWRSARRTVARTLRIRRDRVWLDELPDHLLRDIGISRVEIWSATRFGRGYSDRIAT
ncbi:DUF1127 domain-containing protein [Mesorhizobium sp. M1C.F.Ca.ET.193.01.1.1]|uniref:DUF1127 domain-containing protein n=1 Tax=unclassified Mesorhizobium TaxID=325217 RepID=UPI000FD32569|nr:MULTISPECIES: DUF1127 domain-containing protein [unclassified Mesorhizobium]TGT04284.1 DUF1127 domain-containing protein [bacterium M00.F.Ca.ET.177.01.1.1]TGQ56874.1 DUF1127 domain-containing protein [Mesorhizobium sp. M1C.F.Ca.ET.210.01.1.1]TGQ75641.1 DUF1127 domain-containing protein [Mesorhizobium sp. M1C.F.Ca.ET.212.01.1.1]TGR14050.1 DUF1127 domain-containing protein [Mesorhizobium sp. M1C.F.Ca.ET.204.01.1.1]TGR34305.1 DUF1127 domain-containing protein [Mesorhizobium sp. M1C.F.Ca.ET.196